MIAITVTPTIDTSLYDNNDALGTKLEFSGVPDFGYIVGARVVDKSATGAGIKLYLFSEDFTETADNDAFDISATDAENLICELTPLTTATFTSSAVHFDFMTDKQPYALSDLTQKRGRLYGQLLSDGGGTYLTDSDLVVTIYVDDEHSS